MNIIKFYLRLLLSKKNILIITITSLLVTVTVLLLYKNLSFNDLLFWQFWGQGEGVFSLTGFLTMLVYNSVPIYLLCYFLDRDNERSIHLTIRLKSIRRWTKGVFFSGSIFVVCYVLISVMISALTALVSGMDFTTFNSIQDIFSLNGLQLVNPGFLFLGIFVEKSIELIFYFLIAFLIYCFTKKIITGFLLLQLAYFLYFIPVAIFRYLPVGIGSLSRIKEFSGTGLYFWQIVAFLLTSNVILYGYINIFGCKKIFY